MTKISANFLKVYIFTLAPTLSLWTPTLTFILFPWFSSSLCFISTPVWNLTSFPWFGPKPLTTCPFVFVSEFTRSLKSFSHLRNTNNLNLKITNSSFNYSSALLTKNLSLATFSCKLKSFFMLFVCLDPIHPTYFSLPTWIPEYMCTSLAEKLGLSLFLCLVTVRVFGTHLSCQNLPLKVFFLWRK